MQDEMELAPAKNERKAARKAAGEASGFKNIVKPIARLMVHGLWLQDWLAANPEGTPAERKAAWNAARQGEMDEKLSACYKVLVGLQRQGVDFTYVEKAKGDADADSDDDTDA